MPRLPLKGLVLVIVMVVTVVADQGTKAWARTLPTDPVGCMTAELAAHTCRGVAQPVIDGYWDWELAMNTGAAFSMFGSSRIVLSGLALIAIGLMVLAMWRTPAGERWRRLAYALLAGGALGNLVDRVRDGAVTDFVRWRVHEHHWPIFNLADVALVLGVVVLLATSLRPRSKLATAAATT
ncbi:MAG: signal peptidase II [Deltaproteobacteria bacterium]|nr:signal peptidase II [Deltaproteobacteria bacterium]